MADLTDQTLITEHDIRAASIGSTLRISPRTLVTPLAADLARERDITLVRDSAAALRRPQRRRIAIGADHGGFEMKEALKKVLEDFACDFQDFGTTNRSGRLSGFRGSGRAGRSRDRPAISAS